MGEAGLVNAPFIVAEESRNVQTLCGDTSMKIKLQVLVFIVSFLVLGRTSAEAAPSIQAQLTPLLNEMLAAANAHDTDRFMAMYARSNELVVTFDDQTMRGWQTVRDQQFEWWDGGNSDAAYRLRSAPEITVITPDVVSTLQSMEVASTLPDGKKGSVLVVATSIWRKLPEGWRIVVAHESLIQ